MSAKEEESGPSGEGMTCDFCDQVVAAVRRVALDGEYERLRTPHEVRYACPACFKRKNRQRDGLSRSS